MTAEAINDYLINKGDIDGMLIIKHVGNIIQHGYFYIEDQNDYSMKQNKWQFAVHGGSLMQLDGNNLISIEYLIN
jgi:hypothetical protein